MLVDDAIKKAEQDVLGRIPKVKMMVDEIMTVTCSTSIAFGVTGEWGTGKTSFLNLIVEEIENRKREDILVVKFNPWINLGGQTIIQEFFDTLLAKIRPKDYNIWDDLERYSKDVISANPGGLYQLLGYVLGFRERNDKASGFQRVNDSLNRLGIRFLVILDDMDRLKPEEVFEVLKLIRNTANFDNFIYLAAYDKSYIVNSLKKLGIPNHENFIDKIFLREEQLSLIGEDRIKDYFADLLKSLLKEKTLEIEKFFEYTPLAFNRNRQNFSLKNIRDVKRFLNGFLQDYGGIKDDVVFKDYLNIKLLKFKFYEVYRLLYADRYYFLEMSGNIRTYSSQNRDAWQLAFDDKVSNNNYRTNRPFEDFRLGEFVATNLNLSQDQIVSLKKLVYDLFASDEVFFKNHLSIVFTANYSRYFEDIIGKDEISEQEFISTFAKDMESLQSMIKRWKKEGKIDAARARFAEVSLRYLQNRQQYEKLVRAIFFIASLKVDQDGREMGYLGYDHRVIIGLLGNEEGGISQRFYDNDPRKLKEFVIGILKSNEYSRTYVSQFLKFWYSDSPLDDRWIFTKMEIKELILGNFKAYVETNDPNEEVWSYYRSCSVLAWDEKGTGSWQSREHRFPEGQDIMRNYIEKHLDYFLVDFLRPQPSITVETSKNIILMDWVKVIYGSKEDFWKFLNEAKGKKEKGELQSEFLDEFMVFMRDLKKNGYDGITFDFQYSPAQQRLVELRKRE
ncbi:P-loop NTPase fold protein [Allomuricauda taeanensis]|uniref:KAP family P-loop NTPase fold protein n=1 Tax=Flagellimonas taeanensis TaxID=1005926 RepID=UPI002E7B3EEB|nr:P-loop NTPase fold protein [Allomuricauda taeanensis]MEE1962776.1 P-loop NTPase fold protein [Allomuricauda taeanensis]